MPLLMPDNDTVDYFISAMDDHGLGGASLAPGQTDTVSASDLNLVLAADSTPRPAPDGTASIASGTITTSNPVTNRGPITVTSHIANADGSDSGIPDAMDTVTLVAGLAKAQGVLFGVPFAPIPPTAKKK